MFDKGGFVGWARWWRVESLRDPRFLMVGAFNAVFGYLLFWALLSMIGGTIQSATGLGEETVALLVQWLSWAIAVVEATVAMKYLVFLSPGRFWPQVGRAYLVYLPAQGVAALVLFLALRLLGLRPLVGQLFAIAATTAVSYFGHKHFTFVAPGSSLEPGGRGACVSVRREQGD